MNDPSTPLLLDGGLATELRAAGVPLSPPWWTTRAVLTEQKRRILRDLHKRFLASGARVLTANTFRCNLRTLRTAGLDAAGLGWMVHAAVSVALAARQHAGIGEELIAGSMAPVKDCYRPDLVPGDDELRVEHRWLATELIRSGVDLILIETMNSLREARIALEQVLDVGGRAWVGFVCDGGRLLSGEGLAEAAAAMEAGGAEAVLVNCTQPAETEACLAELRQACRGRIGAYPNLEDRTTVPQWTHVDRALPAALSPAEFGELVAKWRAEFGLDIVGGCCGTSPEHLAAARETLARTNVKARR